MYTHYGFIFARLLVVLGLLVFVVGAGYTIWLSVEPARPVIDVDSFVNGGLILVFAGIALGVLCEISTKVSARPYDKEN